MYSQNLEEKFIVEYFKGFTGILLDVGANDGKTFSNSLRLIELGWRAVLLEPSAAAFAKLEALHRDNPLVECREEGMSGTGRDEYLILHESGHHLPDKSDIGLLSTFKESEKLRWKGVDFSPAEVYCIPYYALVQQTYTHFDFITIDAEGMDVEILKQIDLSKTKLLCIEHNSVGAVKQEIISYCQRFGMTKVIHENAENLLIAR